MRIITTRELRNNTKAVFERAKTERVAVKRGDQLITLVTADDTLMDFVNGTWARQFFAIPEEFRVNPFEISPSGDVFWADRRNIEHVDKALEGPTHLLTEEEENRLFRID